MGTTLALSLIALAMGYRVFAEATKETRGLREGGRAIGILIIVVSLCAMAYGLLKFSCYGKSYCPFGTKMAKVCPVSK